MPRYDYQCTVCRHAEERTVSIIDVDNQQCRCGGRLKRLPHYNSLQIVVPTAFSQSNPSDYPTRPDCAETAARWERDGVRPISDKGKWI